MKFLSTGWLGSKCAKVLTLESMNQSARRAEYAVRGEIPRRAEQLHHQLQSHPGSLPFKKIVQCNIGNPQELGQTPITFIRQVTALAEYPELMSPENLLYTSNIFPTDVIERVKGYRASGLVSSGVYTGSQGLVIVRQNVAKFIEERDGYPSDPNNIFLTNGASGGVQLVSNLLTAHSKCGIMIPMPQYPLYTATMTMLNGVVVPYYLDEEKDWALSISELEKQHESAVNLGIDVRAMVIINPGNPTGSCLTHENLKEIVDFCYRRQLVIMADEVYQTNIYDPTLPFHSMKKVLKSMGPKYEDMELVSFHSTSKGFIGECGKRGGYFELVGFEQDVRDEMYKVSSIQLCPNVIGQIATDCMVRPPVAGEPSFDLYITEKTTILESLKRRSKMLVETFNELEGVTCNPASGAMYVFPRIRMPAKAVAEAIQLGKQPDTFYCLKLLEATGVCTVPGSGFRQEPGTFHIRITFLPLEKDMPDVIATLKGFHESFMDTYR